MQALVLNGELLYRQDVAKPEPAEGQALIKLNLAGICATDLELAEGYAGFSGILGHEFVGTVEAVHNPEHSHWLKRRVVGSINIGCGRCETCRQQGPAHCLQRKVLGIRGKDGVFADYFTLPVANLYAVPDDIADSQAVFAEPLAAALRVVEQLRPLPYSEVAVLGPGRLGLLIAQTLVLAGYNVTLLGRAERSLDLPKRWGVNVALADEIAGDSFDCVVDATGQASGFRQALRIIKPRGTLLLKSTFVAREPVDLAKVVVYELNVLGSRCGPFAEALKVLGQKSIALESMVDGRYALKDGIAAFRHAAQAGVRKILLQP